MVADSSASDTLEANAHLLASLGSLHPYAVKLPTVKSSGNQLDDDRASAMHQQLQIMVDACLKDRNHVAPLFAKLASCLSAMNSKPKDLGSEAFNKPPGTIGTLATGEFVVWTVQWLAGKSDMSSCNIVAAIKFDDQAPSHLVQYATGLGAKLALPKECGLKEVLARVLDYYYGLEGGNLQGFRASGGLLGGGQVSWKCKAYKVQMSKDGSIVESVLHSRTNAKVDVSRFGFSREYRVTDNYSVMSPSLVRMPLPPIKLCSLFNKAERVGPWKAEFLAGKSKTFNAKVAEIHTEWKQSKVAAGSSGTEAAQAASKEVCKMKAEKRKQASAAARKTAVEVIKKSKLKRQVPL